MSDRTNDPGPFDVLDIAPTADADAIRAAYRERLKTTSPETDPEGFQRLREARDLALALTPPASRDTPEDESAPPTAEQLEAMEIANELNAHRLRGDLEGGLAYLNDEMARHPPGSELLTALEMHLFYGTALGRSVSPRLFRALVERFDWTDMQGLVAEDNPEAHSVVLDRLAAEDWWDDLTAAGAAEPPDRVAAALMGTGDATRTMLVRRGLSEEERADVRRRFDEVGTHARFVLGRLDGQSLALLREGVEGPPSIEEPTAAVPLPPPTPSTVERRPLEPRGWPLWLKVLLGGVALYLGRLVFLALFAGPAEPPSQPALVDSGVRIEGQPVMVPGATDGSLSRGEAIGYLFNKDTDYVEVTRDGSGAATINWSPLLRARAGLSAIRYGFDTEAPDKEVAVNALDDLTPMPVPLGAKELAVEIVFANGGGGPTRTYDLTGAAQ